MEDDNTVKGVIEKLNGIAAEIESPEYFPEFHDELFSRLAREAVLTKVHWFDPDLCPCEGCAFNRQEIERIRTKYQ